MATYMMHVLAANNGGSALTVSLILHDSLVLERLLLSSQVPLRGVVITVVELSVLNSA